MADEKIVVDIDLDTSGVKKAFATIPKEAKKAANASEQSLVGAFKKVRGNVIAIGAVIAGVFTGKIIQAAIRQEEAINSLETALRLAGDEASTASIKIQKFAAGIEATTRFSDELVLEQFALARTFTKSADAAQDLVQAAIDLSAGTGGALSLESAVKNLGKTFSGLTGELGEVLPQLKSFSAEQLKSGAAIEFAAKRFGGAAAAQTVTFAGATEQAANKFGTLLENIGFLITRSPKVISAINATADAVGGLADKLTRAFPASFASETERNRLQIRALTVDIIKLQDNLKGAEGQLADSFSPDLLEISISQIKNQITSLEERRDSFVQRNRLIASGGGGGEGTSLADALGLNPADFDVVALEEKFTLANEALIRAREQKLVTEQMFNALEGQLLIDFQAKRKTILDASLTEDQKRIRKLNEALKASTEAAVASSVQSVTQQLLAGKNAFSAIGGALLGLIGDILIQIGTSMISIGSAMEAVRASIVGLVGGPSIFAGIALIGLGTLLKSLSGGGESSASASVGGGVTASAQGTEVDAFEEPEEVEKPGQQIAINVQGTVIDPKTTGQQIAEVLEEYFDSTGSRIVSVG